MKKNAIIIAVSSLLLTILDQITKWAAFQYLEEPLHLNSWISLEYAENTGVAFSIPVPPIFMIPLTVILLGGIILYSRQHFNYNSPTTWVCFSLIYGGALGNLYDRMSLGYVIDFIKIGWWPVFNLADAFLTAGIFLVLAFYGKIRRT